MIVDREAVWAALFAIVSGLSDFKTANRRVRHWTEVPPTEQPAFFQAQQDDVVQRSTGMPSKWTMRGQLLLYVYSGTPGVSAAPALNALLDTVERAFEPRAPKDTQTLGGLVSHCWLTDVKYDEGALGEQAVAIATVEIVAL